MCTTRRCTCLCTCACACRDQRTISGVIGLEIINQTKLAIEGSSCLLFPNTGIAIMAFYVGFRYQIQVLLCARQAVGGHNQPGVARPFLDQSWWRTQMSPPPDFLIWVVTINQQPPFYTTINNYLKGISYSVWRIQEDGYR